MSRYRPPQPQGSPYITPAGYRRLQQELDGLWPRRATVTQALGAAAAEGDRSENAEYIYRKKELRALDRRIRYLQKRLPDLKVVMDAPAARARVFFGARVRLETPQGYICSTRTVGPDVFDLARGDICADSPPARVLLKKTLYDEVCVPT